MYIRVGIVNGSRDSNELFARIFHILGTDLFEIGGKYCQKKSKNEPKQAKTGIKRAKNQKKGAHFIGDFKVSRKIDNYFSPYI